MFDSVGGNIGRSTDNDWVLPDPQRFISAHHARIHFRDGLYILEDTSTNGVYINDDERPVAKRGAHVLQNGDILRFGEYQVVAMVEARAPAAPDEQPGAFGSVAATSSVVIHTAANSVEVLATVGQAEQTDLGASLDLDDLLHTDAEELHNALAVNAYGQPVAPPASRAWPISQRPRAPPPAPPRPPN